MRNLEILFTAALFVAALPVAVLAASLPAQTSGSIDGRVARGDGRGLGGVTVVVSELGLVDITGDNGDFELARVPAGTYTLSFTLGDNTDSESGVEVPASGSARVDKTVDWDVTFAETITVFSALRRRQRIVEAPAAVTVITEQQIEREAAHGQLPKLLELTPGAEVTQNGLYDFNFNSRGFNSSINRRVKVLIDGRDPSVTFLGSQEWSSLTIPLDDLASVEVVRGPGSALYGADAYNGVISLTTRSPADSAGGRFRATGGELSTTRADLSVSGELGGGWYGRLSAGALESDDYSRSRLDLNGNGILDVPAEGEYPGLPVEAIPLPRDRNQALWGNLRLDRDFGDKTLSLEAGYSQYEAGGASVSGIGRVQLQRSERGHFRFNFNALHWNVLGYHNQRQSPATSIATGGTLYLDSDVDHIEMQGNAGFAGGRGRLIGGASYTEESVDTARPGSGVQSLLFAPVDADFTGVFGQLEVDFGDRVQGVVSARYDESSLWDSELSPRAALVFSPSADHTFRVSYGEAFQSANYGEFFLQVPLAPPLTALASFELLFCAPFGVRCGLDAVPIKALGNPDVEVEKVRTFEAGYSGIFGKKAFLTLDYYSSRLESFLTDLIPAFNSTLGLLNPAFGPYRAPGAIPEPLRTTLENLVLGAVPTMTNDPMTGLALLKAVTYANFGAVDTQGIELGLNLHLTDGWLLSLACNWFDFDVKEQLAADPLLANAPENQVAAGLSYVGERFDVAAKVRHVDSFPWAAGVFRGTIEAYDLVDLSGSYRINRRVTIGVSVSNLLDEKHYQIFGGDLIGRRALGNLQFSW